MGIVRLQAYPHRGVTGGAAAPPQAAVARCIFPPMHSRRLRKQAFAINGFAGLTGAQILSFWLSFILFNAYVAVQRTGRGKQLARKPDCCSLGSK